MKISTLWTTILSISLSTCLCLGCASRRIVSTDHKNVNPSEEFTKDQIGFMKDLSPPSREKKIFPSEFSQQLVPGITPPSCYQTPIEDLSFSAQAGII